VIKNENKSLDEHVYVINLDQKKDSYSLYHKNPSNDQSEVLNGEATFLPTHIKFMNKKGSILTFYSIDRSTLVLESILKLSFFKESKGQRTTHQCNLIDNPIKGNQI